MFNKTVLLLCPIKVLVFVVIGAAVIVLAAILIAEAKKRIRENKEDEDNRPM